MARQRKESTSKKSKAQVPQRLLKHLAALGLADAAGVRERQPPPQPNLSMRGRTPDAMLRQVEAWHERLGRTRRAGELQWETSGIRPFELETGTQGKNLRLWRIRELLSSADLLAEGRAMKRCVGTYAQSCARGACSIWALEVDGFDGLEKRQTVEVNRHKMIVQSRGKRNVLPTQQEREMLDRWATKAGLEVSAYLDNAW